MNGAALAYLNVVASAVIVVDRSLSIMYINHAAESQFGISLQQAASRMLSMLSGCDVSLCEYCERVFATGENITLYDYTLLIPMHHQPVTLHISMVNTQQLLITIEKSATIDWMSGNLWKQQSMQTAGVMAAMMAHEVKNPLSGIRGAAQLLKEEVALEYRGLTEFICMETDRIRDLLNQVEIFGGSVVETKQSVNIHEILQYVISIASTGFATHVYFKEHYDPSLPMVLAHRDLLVQMFLNLIKNAAEALSGKTDARITISTHYRSGYRLRRNDGDSISLPILVSFEDNGPGIDHAIRDHLFEPFISSKEDGRGLGLAVVAKIASDLQIVVELNKDYENGTRFYVWLPVCNNAVSVG
jgi:two-component system, NtrC family, nitrogen regulation sensor histidine kinase GlnL